MSWYENIVILCTYIFDPQLSSADCSPSMNETATSEVSGSIICLS